MKNPKKIHYGSIIGMSNKELQSTAADIIEELQKSRQENEIFHYKAVSPEAEKIHLSGAKTIGIGGGNGKDTVLHIDRVRVCTRNPAGCGQRLRPRFR